MPERHARGGRGYGSRPTNLRPTRKLYLMVGEGEKTEPNYFRKFRIPVKEIDIRGIGDNTLSLVSQAVALKNGGQYDRVWCVFDRDSFPPDQFNNALGKARAEGMKIAYTNQAFELWYLLHFHYFDAALDRSQYKKKLTDLLGFEYRKNDDGMYDALRKRQPEAIRNAKRLMSQYASPNPENDNPSTTVHELVEELNDEIQGRFSPP